MMQMRITFKGMDDLHRKLKKVAGAVTAEKTITRALTRAAEPIRKAASAKAPVRTGHLSENIVIEPVKDRNLAFQGVGVFAAPGEGLGSRRSFYAHMQEFGTRHHASQPFMLPAYDENKRRAIRIVRDELESEIRRAAK